MPAATLYRVIVRRHSGAALAVGGEEVLHLESNTLELGTEAALDVGHYTWEGWAVVNGLDVPLGSLDFEVAQHPEASAVGTRAGFALVEWLEAAGFRGEARYRARFLEDDPRARNFLERSARR